MSLMDWMRGIFSPKKEVKEEDESLYTYKCPNCGSTNIGYFTGIANFIEVVQDSAEPRYKQSAKCWNCGFKSEGTVDDENDEYLDKFIKVLKADLDS